MSAPISIKIISGRTLDDIAAADVLSRFLKLYYGGDADVSASFPFPGEESDQIRYSKLLGMKIFTVGYDLPLYDVKRIVGYRKEVPPLPLIWSRNACSEKYIYGIDGKSKMGEYAVSLPGHLLALSMCKIIRNRYSRESILDVVKTEEDRYSELRTAWGASAASVLLPKVIDPGRLFASVSADASVKFSSLAAGIEKICDDEEAKAAFAAEEAVYADLSGTKIGIAFIRGERGEAKKELVVPEMLKRCGIVLLCEYKDRELKSFEFFTAGRERLYPLAEAVVRQVVKGRKNCMISDKGISCFIYGVKAYNKFGSKRALLEDGLLPSLREYFSSQRDKRDVRLLKIGERYCAESAGYGDAYGLPERDSELGG